MSTTSSAIPEIVVLIQCSLTEETNFEVFLKKMDCFSCYKYHTKPSKSVFSIKSHWIKTQISGMVELGMLMKFHYRKGFGNPVVVSEGEVQS